MFGTTLKRRVHNQSSMEAIRVCPRCQGHRVEVSAHNKGLVRLEQTCGQCDGEGVVRIPGERAKIAAPEA